MLRLVIANCLQDDWNQLIAQFPGHSFVQRWEYGEAKAALGAWRAERCLFLVDDQTAGACQIMLRPLPWGFAGGLAWINRAPLLQDEKHLPAMMDLLRQRYVMEQDMYLRIAPAADEGLAEKGWPEKGIFQPAGCLGWASAVVDLTLPEHELRQRLDGKWRHSLTKSEKSLLKLRSGHDGEVFAAFLHSHQALIDAKGFAASITCNLLATLQDLLKPGQKMEAFLACLDGKPVAAALMAKYGDAAEYLAGNVSAEGRRVNAGQFVLWQALLAMKSQGYKRFDLGGMDSILTPAGVFAFKQGLAGAPYRLAPEVEALDGSLVSRLVRWRVQRARAGGN